MKTLIISLFVLSASISFKAQPVESPLSEGQRCCTDKQQCDENRTTSNRVCVTFSDHTDRLAASRAEFSACLSARAMSVGACGSSASITVSK